MILPHVTFIYEVILKTKSHNEPPCGRRVKGKHMKRNFGSSSGGFQPI
jgi:hypothetical protein